MALWILISFKGRFVRFIGVIIHDIDLHRALLFFCAIQMCTCYDWCIRSDLGTLIELACKVTILYGPVNVEPIIIVLIQLMNLFYIILDWIRLRIYQIRR